jgi:tetratricopeptide (TPR) repeat protein
VQNTGVVNLAAILVAALTVFAIDSPGVVLYRARKFPEAERALRDSLKKQPRNPELRFLLARTLIELNRIDEALAELNSLLEKEPSPDTEMEAGRLLRVLAEKRFRDLSRSDSGQAAVSEIAGRRLEREGNFAAALARYQDAWQREPDRPGLRYSIGGVLWKMRDFEGAEKNLRAELERTPRHGMANFRLGQVLMQTGRDAESVEYFERAMAAMPDRVEVRRELGKAYRKTGRLADAQAAWEIVAKARPSDDQIHFLLGVLYRELGNPTRSQQELSLHHQLLERRRISAERH